MSARNPMLPRQRTDEAIRIVAYDSRWPQRFAEERTLLEEAIGPWVASGIHHVGSTAVPGRADPSVAVEYAALKRKLAGQFAHDRDSYTEAKSAFIRDVLGQGA